MMVFEIATIDVLSGEEAAFEADVARAAPHFHAAQGCRSMRLERSVETPAQYRLVVGWDTVEDHMVRFRESEGFQHWRALASPHFSAPPKVEHVETVLDAF